MADASRDYGAIGVGAAGRGTPSLAMAADTRVTPLSEAPIRPYRDIVVTLDGSEVLDAALVRADVAEGDARAASQAIAAAFKGKLADGTKVELRLGAPFSSGRRPIEKMALRASFASRIELERRSDRLIVKKVPIPVSAKPIRVNGTIGQGLYWSLRDAGVSARAAADFIRAIGGKMDVGELVTGDRFDLVVEERASEAGDTREGQLLFAGIDRQAGGALALMPVPGSGKPGWFDLDGSNQQEGAMGWPVNAPITSGFGMRRHPILRYLRPHNGIDFGAVYGAPVYASADGTVSRAGWVGGYGQHVRLQHGGGIGTSYSHLSRIEVSPGEGVRRGQLIGYVGATGLATGAHLHYEVYRNGAPVDPRGVTILSGPIISAESMAKLKARHAAYMQLRPRSIAAPTA